MMALFETERRWTNGKIKLELRFRTRGFRTKC